MSWERGTGALRPCCIGAARWSSYARRRNPRNSSDTGASLRSDIRLSSHSHIDSNALQGNCHLYFSDANFRFMKGQVGSARHQRRSSYAYSGISPTASTVE